ncbi:MAG: ester cyclase [Chloroflexi bacterium]|nr:ester cyclase [Chloroflexota bacterium]
MAERDAINLARENIEAFNVADWGRLKSTLAADSVYDEVGTQRRIQGADRIVDALKGWKQAMPDAKGTVTNAFASGNTATLEITWEGTQTGPLTGPAGTIPPSGKRQTTRAAFIVMIEGDQIKESHQYFDMMTLLQQIGAAPGS